MNETQVLERLTSAYASVAAPTPSAELAARVDRGGAAEAGDDGTYDAIVVPLVVARPRAHVRYLVAATVATVAVFSGLAVAGALPGPIQRQVSSVVSHFGIDLPAPGRGSDTPNVPKHLERPQPTSPVTLPVTSTSEVSSATQIPETPTPIDTSSLAGTLGNLGVVGDPATTTTLPPTGSGALPGVQPPAPTVAPSTVSQTTLPPATVPEAPRPPLPPLPLRGL